MFFALRTAVCCKGPASASNQIAPIGELPKLTAVRPGGWIGLVTLALAMVDRWMSGQVTLPLLPLGSLLREEKPAISEHLVGFFLYFQQFALLTLCRISYRLWLSRGFFIPMSAETTDSVPL